MHPMTSLLGNLQDGFPARLKGLHMIEPPWYISLVLTLVKPFMKEKLRQRVRMPHLLSCRHLYILVAEHPQW